MYSPIASLRTPRWKINQQRNFLDCVLETASNETPMYSETSNFLSPRSISETYDRVQSGFGPSGDYHKYHNIDHFKVSTERHMPQQTPRSYRAKNPLSDGVFSAPNINKEIEVMPTSRQRFRNRLPQFNSRKWKEKTKSLSNPWRTSRRVYRLPDLPDGRGGEYITEASSPRTRQIVQTELLRETELARERQKQLEEEARIRRAKFNLKMPSFQQQNSTSKYANKFSPSHSRLSSYRYGSWYHNDESNKNLGRFEQNIAKSNYPEIFKPSYNTSYDSRDDSLYTHKYGRSNIYSTNLNTPYKSGKANPSPNPYHPEKDFLQPSFMDHSNKYNNSIRKQINVHDPRTSNSTNQHDKNMKNYRQLPLLKPWSKYEQNQYNSRLEKEYKEDFVYKKRNHTKEFQIGKIIAETKEENDDFRSFQKRQKEKNKYHNRVVNHKRMLWWAAAP